jgi:hypothetical protein
LLKRLWAGLSDLASLQSLQARVLAASIDLLSSTTRALALVMAAAGNLPVEKRGIFLERVAAKLAANGSRFTTADFDNARSRRPAAAQRP